MRRAFLLIAGTVALGVVAAAMALPVAAGAWGPARSGGLGHQVVLGGPGADYLRGAEGPDIVRGRGGADLLTGDTGPDAVAGGSGSDTISGGSGNDVLDGEAGNDVISGGFGKDGIHGGSGADALDGGSDADKLSGGPGADVLHGGSGVDRLDGGDGEDRIFSETGADEIDGGPGSDTIVIDGSAFGHVRCGAGRDTLYIVVDADATADYAGRGIVAQYAEDCESVNVTDALDDPNKGVTYLAADAGGARRGSDRDDTLLGGPGADTLSGGDGNDVLWGLRQPDVVSFARDELDGGRGDDTIYGGPGAQRIEGGDGDDFLEGGLGDGAIFGGPGRDIIRLRGAGLAKVDAGAGNDTIYARGPARGRIRCGRGRDVVHADAGDTVARDCERRIGSSAPRARASATYADGLAATPGLVHWWRLGERPELGAPDFFQITDRVGAAVGSLFGGTLAAAGVVDDGDSAWEAGRDGGHLSLFISDAILHREFTFEAWFRADDVGTDRAMLTDTIVGTTDGVVLVRAANGSLQAVIASSTDLRSVTLATPALNLTSGSWHHVALTRADDRVAIYVDGAVAAETAATPVDIARTTQGIGVGQRFGRAQGWFGGIDEIALYDRPLDAATIAAHAHAGDDGTAPVARVDPPLAPIVPASEVVHLTADRAGASFRCALDSDSFLPCRPEVPLYAAADGDHTLRVLATSRTGVAQLTPTIVTFRLDARLPGTVLVVRISPDGDGRAIASFASNQAARFECRQGGSPLQQGGWLACTAPVDVQRSSGFEVRAIDDAGNRDSTPAAVYVPPARQNFSSTPIVSAFAGARAEARIAGEPVPPLSGSRFQCRLDARDWAACPRTVRLPILDTGTHVFSARQSIVGDLATTPPLTWHVGPPPGETAIAGLQAPLILERTAGLLRRAPTVRFALSSPAVVRVSVLRRGRTAITVSAAGRTGSNVVAIPSRRLYAQGTGRYTIRVVARSGSGATTTQQLPLAIVPPLR